MNGSRRPLTSTAAKSGLSLVPGVPDLLKGTWHQLGTATSLPRMLAEPALKNNRIYHLFDAFTTTDEAGRSKEYPDVYLLAAKRLGVPPGNCIVFEDILPGIKAVRAAGMRPTACMINHQNTIGTKSKPSLRSTSVISVRFCTYTVLCVARMSRDI